MGGKGGKGGVSTPNINIQPSPYEQRMAQIAEEYWGQTSPLRYAFLNDFGAFIRPEQARGGMGTTAGSNVTGSNVSYTQPTTSAPMSTNFANTAQNIPSSEDIYNNLRMASVQGLDNSSRLGAMNFLGNLGVNNVPVASQVTWGQESPEYLAQLKSQAADIRQNALNQSLAQGMQQIAQQGGSQAVTSSQGGGSASSFTSSNLYNPYNLPAYAPLYQLARTGIESQYNPARQNILASTPRGGALYESLGNLEMSRAQQAGSLPAQIAAPLIGDIYNKAYSVAFGAPQTTIAGMSAADQGLTSRYNAQNQLAYNAAAQQAALNQQSSMGLGTGLGSLMGLGLKGLGSSKNSILGGMLGMS